ncbi:hypothetical protein [Clostridium haemolyticum]|nr:hypothetical protein [Clostridium haemolyticum]
MMINLEKKIKKAIDKLKKSVIYDDKEQSEKYNEELIDLLFELD